MNVSIIEKGEIIIDGKPREVIKKYINEVNNKKRNEKNPS